jgi:site-specific DNA recombinase
MAVALYARVSTAKQAEKDLSIPDQLRQMRDYCAKRSWVIAEEYIEDGASATSDRRPVFQAMIAEACSNPAPFEAVVVHSLSRFFRDAIEFGLYERKLAKHGVKLISISQQTSDDSAGILARRIFSVFDEFQSLENGKHTLRSMIENARQGYWNGAPPPYGYRARACEAKGRHGQKKRLEVDPAEAEVVRLIYDLYTGKTQLEPVGLKGVAAHLNSKGLLRRGKPWGKNHVADVLTNPVYTGELCFNRTSGKTQTLKPRNEWIVVRVPAIVGESLRAEADVGRSARRREAVPPRQLTSPLLLAGLIRCGVCGAGMTLATGKGGRYRYYKCTNKISKGPNVCENASHAVDRMDQAVSQALAIQVLEPGHIQGLLQKLQQRTQHSRGNDGVRLDALKNELAENKAGTQRLLEAIERGIVIDDELLRERAHKLKVRRQELLLEIGALSNRHSAPLQALDKAKIEAFSEALRAKLLDTKQGLGRRYVRALVSRVTVKGSEVTVQGPKSALLEAAIGNGTGEITAVPSSVPNWLPE